MAHNNRRGRDALRAKVAESMGDLRSPFGRFQCPQTPLADQERQRHVDSVVATPVRLRDAVQGLDEAQLDTPFPQMARPCVSSYVTSPGQPYELLYVRFNLALTEDEPTIKPYDEGRWAMLEDSRTTPITTSLTILEALHERWVALLRSMRADDFSRRLVRPENGPMTLDQMLALYAWHGPHHVAHVTTLRTRNRW